MRCFGSLLLLFILCSCGQSTQIHEDVTDINNTIVLLEKELPSGCKNQETITKIEKIKNKLQQVEIRCETQLDVSNNERLRWKAMFYALVAAIIAYIVGRTIK